MTRTVCDHEKGSSAKQTITIMKPLHILLSAMIVLLASCASKKSMDKTTLPTDKTSTAEKQQPSSVQKLTYVQKVYDNQVYAKNITGSISFTVQTDGKNITVPGSLHMRKDEVIRLQLFIPILGSEIGRLEFTPDHVLIVDRLHKEYIQAEYSQVDFLQRNGISFYSLQALFWNQLFLPGQNQLGETLLKKFDVDLDANGATRPVSIVNGNMTYTWHTDRQTGRIAETSVKYSSATHGTSSLTWKYSDFKNVGVKMFPAQQNFTFATNAVKAAKTATVNIKMNNVGTDSKWDTKTTISPKYKKVNANDILKNIIISQ